MKAPEDTPPMGPTIAKNLARLGYADIVIRSSEVAKLATAKGHKMSRQRVAAIMNAVKVTDDTLKAIADAVGVKPEDLLQTDIKPPSPPRDPRKPPAPKAKGKGKAGGSG